MKSFFAVVLGVVLVAAYHASTEAALADDKKVDSAGERPRSDQPKTEKGETSTTTIKLKSSDGKIFETDVDVAKCSGLIESMLEGLDASAIQVVPLPNVNSVTLEKVLQWATYHKDDKNKQTDVISNWDADFLKVDQATLFELTQAANYLNIKGLLDVTCKTIANMIKGKTAEEIRQTFNIKNDFTPSEEEEIRRQNDWNLDV